MARDIDSSPTTAAQFSAEEASLLAIYSESWPLTPPDTSVSSQSISSHESVTTPTSESHHQVECIGALSKTSRGSRTSRTKKERRKRYRMIKKRSHKQGWEVRAEEALKQKWHQRCVKSHAEYLAEVEERKKKEEQSKIHKTVLKEVHAIRVAEHNYEADIIEQCYTAEKDIVEDCDTSPLLLDTVLTPIVENSSSCMSHESVHAIYYKQRLESARQERDRALSLARQYRDLAEASQAEKRALKNDLEERVELVRNFWRNKVVEGGTRSGQILRAALIRK